MALVVQAIALVVMGIGEGRATLFFGNPNQLSLFALLALAYLLLLHSAARTSGIVLAIGIATAVALILVALSKAAMVSAFVMLALALLFLPVRNRWILRLRPVAIVVLPVAVVGFIVFFRDEFALVNSVLDRLADIGVSADDSLTGRGYSRILEWPQFLLFGAGEGLTERFGVQFEIHSMFGTLLFSYGLPGLLLVLALLAVTARRAPKQFVVLFVPVLLYSLTHHPMRQPMLWALLLFIGACPRIDHQTAGRVG
jgi:O-antigen ligase